MNEDTGNMFSSEASLTSTAFQLHRQNVNNVIFFWVAPPNAQTLSNAINRCNVSTFSRDENANNPKFFVNPQSWSKLLVHELPETIKNFQKLSEIN